MSKIKKIAVLATAFSAGALAYGLAERAKVAGQTPTPVPQPGLSFSDYDPRPLGPDGRPIGTRPPRDGKTPYAKKYYVFDLALPQPPDRQAKTPGAEADDRVMVDLTPLVELIEMTVAPATWTVQDEEGHELPREATRRGPVGAKQRNTIVPQLIFGSLIITCSDEVHKDVRNLLYALRRLQDPRDQANTGGTRLAMLVPRTAFANLRDVKPDTTSTSDRQQRDDRLLKQLRALVQEHESAPAGRVSVPQER